MLLPFLLGTLASLAAFKAVAIHRERRAVSGLSAFYLLAPVMSAEALRSAPRASIVAAWDGVLRLVIAASLMAALYWLYRPLMPQLVHRAVPLGYLAIPIVYLLGEATGALAQLAFLPSGRVAPLAHRRPYAASSLADFWGRRWNTWMSEFFRVHVFSPMRRHPTAALAVVFIGSGLWHEALIDLPLDLRFERDRFGDQLAYFALQGLGVWIDARIPRRRSRLRRCLLWVVVLAPAPLIINEGMLRCLFLWPGSAAS
jgi:hypothetical protein